VGDTSGTPLPFEDPSRYRARRVRDRLTRQILVGYLAALAIGPTTMRATDRQCWLRPA
jgi:hypothetical protein